MMRVVVKSFVSLAALTAVLLAPIGAANAHDWHHRHRGDAVALGVLGLAAGAIIGGAIASDRSEPVYEVPPPVEYYPPAPEPVYVPAPVYGAASLQPWTQSWYDYCSSTYRSFDPERGT